MVIWMSNNNEIEVKMDGFEVLGSDFDKIESSDHSKIIWVRCYLLFIGIEGEEVIDIPVEINLPSGTLGYFSEKKFNVAKFDEEEVKMEINKKISLIRGRDPQKIFAEIDHIGYSATI